MDKCEGCGRKFSDLYAKYKNMNCITEHYLCDKYLCWNCWENTECLGHGAGKDHNGDDLIESEKHDAT